MKTGFTLIETIAVLLLVAILAVSVGISVLPMSQALMQVRANAAAAQKARLALARVAREFTTITNVVASASDGITYDFLVPADGWYTTVRRSLTWSGDELRLDGVPLCDDVDAFDLSLETVAGTAAPAIVIALRLRNDVGDAAYTTSFTNRIVPRNILQGP